MKRLLIPCFVALAVLGVLLPTASVGSQQPDVTIRIVARQVEDSRIEFGVIKQQADGTWGDRILPRSRFFPADAEVGRWLRSSPIDLSSPGSDVGGCPTLRPGVNDVSMIPTGEVCHYQFEAGEVSYWARLSGFGGSLDEIIANDLTVCRATIVAVYGTDIGFEWSNSC